jgi:alanine racemase
MIELEKVEISRVALSNNINFFRELIGDKLLGVCVKGNAYGHGLVECSKIFLDAGADWLLVNSLYEAKTLRENNIDCPIYIMGYVGLNSLEEAVDLNCKMVVYNLETIKKLGGIGENVCVHLKVETGNNRQGIPVENLIDFVSYIQKFQNIEIEGISTHFANIEDVTNHSFAKKQLEKFEEAYQLLKNAGFEIPIRHCANSAATILFPQTHFDMVRIGVAAYGMWPSEETFLSFKNAFEMKNGKNLRSFLEPAFCWKTKVVQIKDVKQGDFIGYGCTYRAEKDIKLAILAIGYYDGYDRGLSNKSYVLIRGQKAPVRGRVCMNLIMVDVSDIPNVELEDDAVLIGRDGEENILVEQFAEWCETINYEVTTRVNDRIPRVVV